MPGGGSTLQMVQTIKFNKSLLSNRKSFGELKAYLNRRIYKRTGVKQVDIDPIILAQIKKEIRKELRESARRNTIIVWSLISTGIILLISLVAFVYSSAFIETDPEAIARREYDKYKREKIITDAQQKFDYYITDGYDWLEKNEFHNAVYQFELAVQTRPNNYEANLGLCKVYLKQCFIENANCSASKTQLNHLISDFDNPDETKKILSDFLFIVGNEVRAIEILELE